MSDYLSREPRALRWHEKIEWGVVASIAVWSATALGWMLLIAHYAGVLG